MKKQQIKDRDKLFKKLFISPSYSQPLDPPLLVSPDFINLLLQQSATTSKQYQLELINDILKVFIQRPTNSLLLWAHDQNKLDGQKCILDSVIHKILELITTQEEIQLYIQRIQLMISYYRVTLANVRKITQWVSKNVYLQKFDPIKFMFVVRLLKIFYSKKLGELKSPTHYFYIFGSENTGIQPVQNFTNQLSFKNQLTVTLCFNSQKPHGRLYNLFLIKSQKKQQIGLTYSDGCLKITALNNGQFLDQFIVMKGLSDQVWYRLIINLSNSQTECIVQNQSYKGRALLKKDKQRKISSCIFGRQFFGMIGSVLVSNKNIPLQKFDTITYPYGIDTIDNLITLNKTQLPASIILSCLPFCTFQVRQMIHCFDIFKRNHSGVGENIVTISNAINEPTLDHLGGCTIILPLFYLARFYSKDTYPYILVDLLDILLEILKNYNIDELQAQFEQSHFLQILGQHLTDINYLQNQKTVNQIFTIYHKLKKQKSKVTYLRDVIWSLNIGIETNQQQKTKKQIASDHQIQAQCQTFKSEIQKQQLSSTRIYKDEINELISSYYNKLLSIYKLQSHISYKSMSLAQVIYWAVQHLEGNEGLSFTCCLQHHLNQSVLSNQMRIQDMMRLDSSHIKTHYSYLQEILTDYLQTCIRKHEQTIIEQIKTLLRLFLQKYSPCFYLTILKAIKKQITSSNLNIKQVSKILVDPKLQITSFLSFLSEKTINPDIISQILYISLFIHKHAGSHYKEEYVKFIINILKTNQQVSIKNFNPLRVLVKKIRKLSEQIITKSDKSSIQECHPQYNQMFQLQTRNNKKIQIDKHKISRIIQRSPRPQKISTFKSIYNIVLNQLSCQISESQPNVQNNSYTQTSILILKQYYKLAQPVYKQSILLFILSSLEKNHELKNSNCLAIFLLQCLKFSVINSPEETKSLLTIFTCIFSQILTSHSNIVDYYCSIKFLKASRSSISMILPYIMSKVIKLADISQISQMLMITLYQMTQSPQQSALELSQIVLSQLNNKIIKNIKQIRYSKRKASQKITQIVQSDTVKNQNYSIFNKVLCEHPEKSLNLFLTDPFEDQQLFQENQLQVNQQSHFQMNIVIKSQQNTNTNSNVNVNKNEQLVDCELNQIKNSNMLAPTTQTSFRNSALSVKSKSKSKQKSKEKSKPKSKSKSKSKPNSLIKRTSKQISNWKLKFKQEFTQKQNRTNDDDKFQYQKQLRCIEIYIKLYFKVMQRLILRNQSLQQNISSPKKHKILQINYSYQFKSVTQLSNQFLQIIIWYFKITMENHIVQNQEFIRFLLTYLLYKMSNLGNCNGTIIGCNELLQYILVNGCLHFVINQVSSLQQLCNLISDQDNKLIFMKYFSQKPFKFTLKDFLQWKNNTEGIKQALAQSKCCQIFNLNEKYKKFFNQIEDVHDLMIVGFYQKKMQKYIVQYQTLISSFFSEKSFKNIQRLFDSENAAQEKTRISFLYENQCRFRKCHYQWDQLWNKLRIYHQPYGFWMAQRNKDSAYTYPKKKVKNFKFQVSEYPNSYGIYPILQAKIIEPWLIVKDNRIKKNKYIDSFSQMMKPSHLKIQNSNNHENIFTNMWKGMLGLSKKKSMRKTNEYDVVYISRSTKATGKLFIQNKQQMIFCYEGAKQQDSHLSFQKFSLAFNRQTFQKWFIFSIQKIRVHRYLLRYDALEIVLNDGRSVIFNFVNKDKDSFLKQIQKIQKQNIQNNNLKLFKINKIPFLDDNFIEQKGIEWKITQSWVKRQISNLEYLVKLNRAASRGIYDLSQYMVVPWIVQFKKQKQPKYRDLSKTMGGLGSEQRRKIICQKYNSKDPFNPYPPFYFGTHYSSPGVVFNLLIRLSPFTQYCKHLQGGKFDIPDRLFSSLISAWRSASEEVSDVRQLIPQIYYLPQMLINIDQNYFGLTQNNQLINHIQIPPWGANNPYYFTSQLRQIIQSDQISQKINEWIDLIFGYKQKGKQAQTSFNVYYYLTYQDYVDAQQEEDQVYRKSRQAQIVHFGQIPPMLFDRPHPKRNKLQNQTLYQLKLIRSINLMNSLKQKPIGIKIYNNQLTICKRNQFQLYAIQSNPAALQKKKKINFEKSLSQTYYLIKKQKSNVYFFEKPYFVIWGYLSNQFRIFNKNTGEIDESAEIQARITALCVSKAQDLLIVGSSSGILSIFQIQYGLNDIFVKRTGKQFFPYEIVHISEFDGFYTITFGNYSAVYKITRSINYLKPTKLSPSIKFFRSFYNPLPLKASFIMTSPLYTILLIDNASIKSYSINGQFIRSISNSAKYYGRFRDSQLHDVFYAIDQDKVVCYSVPDLRSISIIQLPEYEQIIQNYVINKLNIQEIGFKHV